VVVKDGSAKVKETEKAWVVVMMMMMMPFI